VTLLGTSLFVLGRQYEDTEADIHCVSGSVAIISRSEGQVVSYGRRDSFFVTD